MWLTRSSMLLGLVGRSRWPRHAEWPGSRKRATTRSNGTITYKAALVARDVRLGRRTRAGLASAGAVNGSSVVAFICSGIQLSGLAAIN
jgi:hypothetical protein